MLVVLGILMVGVADFAVALGIELFLENKESKGDKKE